MAQNSSPVKTGWAGGGSEHDRTAWLKGGRHGCVKPPRQPAGRPWRIVMLGAPGIGKGTQAALLGEHLGACPLATDDIFRAARCGGEDELSAAMKNALDYLKRGEPVPDETVLNLAGERLRCLNCSGGFLLDGFPRTVAQAKALEQLLESHGTRLSAVLHYDLPVEQIVARLAGRRTCSRCEAVFHLTTQPPKVAETCDHCGGNLRQREDDRPEAVTVRTRAYHEFIGTLMDFYQQRGLLITISAEGTPGEIFQRTQLALPPN
jgi:adenylate kinase